MITFGISLSNATIFLGECQTIIELGEGAYDPIISPTARGHTIKDPPDLPILVR